MQRRHLLTALSAGLAGCGFELRREPELLFHSLAISGIKPDSAMAAELRRQLSRTSVLLMEDANKAQLVLVVLKDVRERSAVVSTTAGQVREWQLRLNFDFMLRTPNEELLLPRTELRMVREMNFRETDALGKEQEEAQLYRAMQSDAVAQVMRRLAAVRVPS
ncbi:LPS-assembly lipoprotein LptE [Roseateles oligotrophus]|uniref:LPS-assembly lipoprotein LptE n=1 Tax=Roseateles oligotrophus TaxID=1769250 RepID=A0ABT2YJT3_9BURK|nr:LPS assembly lipoprotein LptE [Roseateles oligotrophus]MCV2370319.1 LPS assembly lipoprotein LptE [Roseateles oligotrophus]